MTVRSGDEQIVGVHVAPGSEAGLDQPTEAHVARPSDLAVQTATGLMWTTGAKVGQQLLQFVITVVLARLLVPADFGLVGLIAVFTGFATVLIDFGFSGALIQRTDIEPRHLSSAFWLNIATGAALTLVFAAASPGIAWFYGRPELLAIAAVWGIDFFLNAFSAVQGAIVQRSMRFRRLAVIETAATAGSGVIAIALASGGAGVWSLVAFVLTGSLLRSTGLWLLTDWTPVWSVDLGAIRDLWGFSLNLVGFNAINYWSRNGDNLIVGRVLGATALGIYSRAYTTMLMPLSNISAITARVMFPTLSRLQDEPARVRTIYLRSIRLIALVSFPMSVGLFVAARPFVLALFGPRWEAVIPILKILCISGFAQPIGATVGWIYQSQGRTDWMRRWGVWTTVVTVSAFAIGVHWGIKGVAYAYAVRSLSLTYFNFASPGKLIGMTFTDVLRAVAALLAVSFAMGAIVASVDAAFLTHLTPAARLALDIAIGIAAYAALTAVGAREDLRNLRQFVALRSHPDGAQAQ